jgi:hypothetical protein
MNIKYTFKSSGARERKKKDNKKEDEEKYTYK